MTSGLKFSSFGIVVEDKPPGTDYVLVSPIEELNLQESGLIREKTKNFVGNKKSISSVNFDTEHESKNFVRAKWYDISGGNRTSAPDVVASETVLLLKYGDVDEYFWCDFGREPGLRRLEDVLYSFSNLSSPGAAYDKDSSYWIRVSTRDKFLHIHTADNDGELTTFDIKLDTKAGYIEIKDGLGNFIEMNSREGRIIERATTEIIREAPIIRDISDNHLVETKTLLNRATEITNDAPLVTNTGDVNTAGKDTANQNLNAKCTCPNCVP